MDTPSPELKKTPFSRFATPNGLGCRKMTSSPANFPNKRLTDFNELSMSPLHLMDSPSVRLPAPLTPSTSYAESPRKSPRVLKQTSTPSDRMALTDTPSLKNKAFIISSSSVPSKAKRRLIEDGESTKNKVVLNSSIRDSSFQGNAPKRQKTTPKSAPSLGRRPLKLKKRVGQINFGVSHRIRPKEKPDKLIKRSFGITLSDLKKNRNSDVPRHPFDPVNKSINETHEDVQSQQAQVTEIIQPHPENKMPPIISDSISPLIKGMQRAKLQSPTVAITKEKTPRISPKVITRNWNQRYKTDNRERKFFKSRQSNEDTPNRVVTVSVSENLK